MRETASPAWLATPAADHRGPCVALIHGLLAGPHMASHLLSWLREAGHQDVSLYSNHLPPRHIAERLLPAARAGRRIVLVGFSQGGFQVVKVAWALHRLGVAVDLLVTLAAGGYGRWFPAQWGARPRDLPPGVGLCLVYHAEGDRLGTDRVVARNFVAAGAAARVENVRYARALGIGHVELVRCYPAARVHPEVRRQFLDRLLAELARLEAET